MVSTKARPVSLDHHQIKNIRSARAGRNRDCQADRMFTRSDLQGAERDLLRHDTRALQAYLGHRNIQQIVRYTKGSLTQFKDFWRT